MVTLSGYLIVPQDSLASILEALPQHIAATRSEAGCVEFNVTQDENDPHRLNVDEKFTTQEAFLHHQDRARSSVWGSISKNLQRNYVIKGMDH